MKKRIIKNESGITLTALLITIIVIIIIGTITIREGTTAIKQAKLRTIVTNLLSIKAKAKACAEEVDAATWNVGNDDERQNKKTEMYTGYGMTEVAISQISEEAEAQINSEINKQECDIYKITGNTLTKMGLDDLDDGKEYFIIYDRNDFNKMDIVYSSGISYNNSSYYTLSEMEKIEED